MSVMPAERSVTLLRLSPRRTASISARRTLTLVLRPSGDTVTQGQATWQTPISGSAAQRVQKHGVLNRTFASGWVTRGAHCASNGDCGPIRRTGSKR